jgi:tetratricopeptide (TPR) repeat protein/anti-sigma regulatory factor (Ser/Thr protein kinase)
MIRGFVFSTLMAALVLGNTDLFAQKEAEPESKKSIYSKLKTRSSREGIDELLTEAENLKSNSPQVALEKVKEALAMSITTQNLISESRCYNLLGEINMNIQEFKLALENYSTAREKLSQSKVGDPAGYLKSMQGIGLANLNLKNYSEALGAFQEIERLKPPDKVMVDNTVNISEVYYQTGKYHEALNALETAGTKMALDEASDLKIENQKVKIYARSNQVEKASSLFYSNQSRSKGSSSAPVAKEDAAQIQSAKEELSDVLNAQNRYDDEIALRENSIDYNLDVKNLSEVSKDKVELSKALVLKGETGEAIRELREAAFIADTIGDPKRQSVAYLSLADLYDKYGNQEAAIQNYKKYSEAVARTDDANEQELLEKSGLIRTQRDIEELSKYVSIQKEQENLALAVVYRQRLVIYGLLLIIAIVGITSYFIYKNALASKRANQLLALKSLRSQMNPHFIFNALNSVNQFVSQNDERTTNRFLSEFSRLMRLVLENSQEDFIPLFKEEEIISLYLKLEHYRFRDKFDYRITVDEEINKEIIEIPPMLIQPYIENAVWHGLRYKDSKGFLTVDFRLHEEDLVIEISDDGIGRKRSAEIKTENQKKHESTGLKNIRERLGIINKVYKSNYRVETIDKENGSGTTVVLYVPVQRKSITNA